MGWIRQMASYDGADAFHILGDVEPGEWVVEDSPEWHKIQIAMARIPFTEQDKAWYVPGTGAL